MHPSPQNIALVKISDCLFFMNIQIRATSTCTSFIFVLNWLIR